jgi:hypothetical protein
MQVQMTGEIAADANGIEKSRQTCTACVPRLEKEKEEENACRIRNRDQGGGEIGE